MEVHILDVGLPQLPQAAASFGSVWSCCDHQETPTLCQGCMKDGGMWVQDGDVGKDRETGHSCSILGDGGGTSCVIGAVIQHWDVVLFSRHTTPLGWEPAHKEKRSAATLAPMCFGSRCSTLAQSREQRQLLLLEKGNLGAGTGCAHTSLCPHQPVCTACPEELLCPGDHHPSCFCCRFLALPAMELSSQ